MYLKFNGTAVWISSAWEHSHSQTSIPTSAFSVPTVDQNQKVEVILLKLQVNSWSESRAVPEAVNYHARLMSVLLERTGLRFILLIHEVMLTATPDTVSVLDETGEAELILYLVCNAIERVHAMSASYHRKSNNSRIDPSTKTPGYHHSPSSSCRPPVVFIFDTKYLKPAVHLLSGPTLVSFSQKLYDEVFKAAHSAAGRTRRFSVSMEINGTGQ